jgi:hypothetical protein
MMKARPWVGKVRPDAAWQGWGDMDAGVCSFPKRQKKGGGGGENGSRFPLGDNGVR